MIYMAYIDLILKPKEKFGYAKILLKQELPKYQKVNVPNAPNVLNALDL